MTSANTDIIVRQVETESEIAGFHRVMTESFSSASDVDLESAAHRHRLGMESWPGFHPRQRRGAFRGDAYLGGYIVDERPMRIGTSRLLTGCIGGVGVHPNHRKQGVATALMNEALSFAKEQHLALLLLDGIPNFYHRFGYADIADPTDQVIDRSVIKAWTGESDAVRPATAEDVPALLELFDRHFGSFSGSFARPLEQQTEQMSRSVAANNPPFVAVDETGAVRGYLLLRRSHRREQAREVAADTGPAALGLLRHHEQIVAALPEPSPVLEWPLPPGSTTLMNLVDLLPAPDTWDGDSWSRRWAIRGQTYQRRSAGWMARVVTVRQVVEDLQSVWRDRLATTSLTWSGVFVLSTESESCPIELTGPEARLATEAPTDAPVVRLSSDSLVQAVFGYRPIGYLATRPSSRIPDNLRPVLEILFPAGQPWIPGSDAF